MEAKIVNVGKQEKKQKGNRTWYEFVLEYETDKGTQTRTFRSFEGEIYAALRNTSPGDLVNVKLSKDGDFWKWESVEILPNKKSEVTPAAVAPSRAPGNWETPEERAARQVYIVRQSSIDNAIKFFALQEGSPPTVQNILKLAETFVEFVFGRVKSDEIVSEDKPAVVDFVPEENFVNYELPFSENNDSEHQRKRRGRKKKIETVDVQ